MPTYGTGTASDPDYSQEKRPFYIDGQEIWANSPSEATKIYYGQRGPGGFGVRDRYDDWYDAAMQKQLGAAEELYAGAGDKGAIQAAILRGEAARGTLGGLGEGGLAARGAIQGVGEGAWAAGQEGARTGSSDRLAAAQSYMMAQQQRARYEQARADAWRRQFQSKQQAMRDADKAYRQGKAREEEAAWRTAGAVLGAGAAGMAGASGGGGGGGGQ